MRSRTRTVLGLTLAAALGATAPAQADVQTVFGDIPCADHTYTHKGTPVTVRQCEASDATLVESFDGAPIDVNVTLPKGDGPWPLIGLYHGWGGSKLGVTSTRDWARQGYAVFTMSDRGWGKSCGGGASQMRFEARCANGYNHLMDTRYEVRDSQELVGRLADEGIAIPKKIGALGGSYGGGISMALAALKNRIMLPDGSYAPWRSPAGKDMQIAAAAPEIPWSDLAYSLVPTGRTLDYVSDNPYGPRAGVMKQSFVSGLFALGLAGSNYAAPGQDEDADLFKWYALTTGGETSDQNPLLLDALDELTTHHSSYYIDDSIQPAPLLINNGFTDDLFPVDEAVRFYNKTKDRWPKAKIAMFHMDNGHQRGQNKGADAARLDAAQAEWFAHFLKEDEDVQPYMGVRATTIACGEPSEGPYAARSWRELSPGEVRLTDATTKVVASLGDPRAAQAFDPIAGSGACATADDVDVPGTAVYRLPAVESREYTVLGSPTVIADITAPSPNAQVAARLLDVDPATKKEILVARGLYRPDASGRQVFQLHPTAWRFKKGHVAKLELLAGDTPYGRVSNGGGPVVVSNLELRIPTAEQPGGVISKPAAKVLPAGAELAPDYRPQRSAKKTPRKSRRSARSARR